MRLMNKSRDVIIILFLIGLSGCGIYSFTGANISPDVKTISIENFYNESGDGPPNMNQQFTEGLKEYFQNNTNLAIDNSGNGDLQFSGFISRFNYAPIAPTASENRNLADNAGLQRLTISVSVVYINTRDDSFDFDQAFSFYADFDPNSSSISAIEPQLIEEIFDQIYVDIFNASVANW